jgi:hypothetical protein
MDQAQREKLAADLPAVLQEAANHMELMSHKLASSEKRASDMELELRAMKLARRMEDRGVNQGLTFEQKVAELRGAGLDKLATVEQALEMATGGFRLGAAVEAEVSPSVGAGADPLGDFITSGNAYGT